ncbi:MAG: HK97 gp10 family phage protein [Pseudomonadota bacterium]
MTKLRRTLRRMEEEITEGVASEIETVAKTVEQNMLGMVPVDEGDLASVIAYKIGRDGFSAVIGPGAGSAQIKKGLGLSAQKYLKGGGVTAATARNNFIRLQLYKAHWIEYGTRNVPARPFIQPAWDVNKDQFRRQVRRAVDIAIGKAADG